jgi:hypothetical protein
MERPADRYTTKNPLKFRLLGEAAWRHGTVENMSQSGLLFSTWDRPPEIGAKLEVYFAADGEGLGRRVATAYVVRRVLHCWPDPSVRVAVQFAEMEPPPGAGAEDGAAEDKKHRGGRA